MLKDFLNKKVNVVVAFSDGKLNSIPRQFNGILTVYEENYIKLDNNIILATKFITSVELIN